MHAILNYYQHDRKQNGQSPLPSHTPTPLFQHMGYSAQKLWIFHEQNRKAPLTGMILGQIIIGGDLAHQIAARVPLFNICEAQAEPVSKGCNIGFHSCFTNTNGWWSCHYPKVLNVVGIGNFVLCWYLQLHQLNRYRLSKSAIRCSKTSSILNRRT